MTILTTFDTLRDSVLQQAEVKGQEYFEREKQKIDAEFKKRQEESRLRQAEEEEKTLRRVRHQHDIRLQQYTNKERQTSLVTKQEILTTLFSDAEAAMKAWSKDQDLAFFEKVMAKYPNRAMAVQFGAITAEKLTEADKDALASRYPILTFASQSLTGHAGFILSEGKVDYNYTYAMLISHTKEELSSQIAQHIFMEEGDK